jgi:hypothetical protein
MRNYHHTVMSRGLRLLVAVLVTGSALAACATGPSSAPSTRTISREPGPSPITPAPTGAESLPVTTSSPAGRTGVPSPKPPATGTGIAGVTVLDPVCPVQRADPPCPARPVAARLSVLDATTNAAVATVDSSTDGHFSLALAPGRYTLRAISVGGAPPHSPVLISVAVQSGRYTTVTVHFDTGIR